MGKLIDLTGKRFGRLVVIERVADDKNKNRRWLCSCDCGKEKIIHGSSLCAGRSRSCGCLQREVVGKLFTRHGHSKDKYKIYNTWKSMNQRCVNPKNKEYHNYGGRGIQVCKQWKQSFGCFLTDMGDPPTHKHQIDRINNDKGYCKTNCRWATPKQQQRNRRNNRLITHDERTQTLVAWAEETGIERRTISERIRRGWSIGNALTVPVEKRE